MVAPTIKLTALEIATASSAIVAMTFTASEITAITIAIGALLATIFTGVVNIITVLRTERKVDANTALTVEVSAQAEVIERHVNSAAASSAAKIDELQRQVSDMRAQLAENKERAALLAQAVATAPATAALVAAAAALPPAIEKNTAQNDK